MKNQTLIIAVVVVAVVGLAIASKKIEPTQPVGGQPTNTNNPSKLTAVKSMYDFGTISMAKGKTDYVFKVTNSTDQDINIKTIETSCMCTNAYLQSSSGEKGPFGMAGHGYSPSVNEIIKTGETRNVRVVYDPAAHGPAGVGSIDRFISLIDTTGGTLQLEIKALVTP